MVSIWRFLTLSSKCKSFPHVGENAYLWVGRDWKKLTFYYFADAYINFNSLVTDLFKVYKTRIWMSAINPASFASPSLGLQAPSGIGPGAVGVSRTTPSRLLMEFLRRDGVTKVFLRSHLLLPWIGAQCRQQLSNQQAIHMDIRLSPRPLVTLLPLPVVLFPWTLLVDFRRLQTIKVFLLVFRPLMEPLQRMIPTNLAEIPMAFKLRTKPGSATFKACP